MAYINPTPGTSDQVVLRLDKASSATVTGDPPTAISLSAGNITVPALQDVTINNANDVFTWSQLDATAKKQVATTSTNSIDLNIVVDDATFFGTVINAASTGTTAEQGLLGLSRNKTKIAFALKMRENSSSDRWVLGLGYITGLAPTLSADAPVWVTPVTITVDGEFLIQTAD
jgi:hypothetical protein